MRDGGEVRWEMVVIAWCASVSSAVISHTTCCCDAQPSPAPCHLVCACALMRLCGCLMGFRAGDESTVSPFPLSLPLSLWRLSARREKTDSYLGLCCKLPLKWVLTVIPSRCLGPELSWENNLMIPGLINGGRTEWMEMFAEGNIWGSYCLSSGLPREWTSSPDWIDLHNLLPTPLTSITSQPLRDTHTHAHEIIISQQALWLPARCCCCCSGCLYGLLNDWLGGASALCMVFSTTYCDFRWLIQYMFGATGALGCTFGCMTGNMIQLPRPSISISAAQWNSPSSHLFKPFPAHVIAPL